MARKQRTRQKKVKIVQIIVGEGSAEKAFLLHLKSIYADGSKTIKIKSAGGKGPNNVINDAIGEYKASSGAVLVAAFLDTDLKWPVTAVKEAKAKGIELIGSEPCLEGLLLTILGKKHPIPPTNANLKKAVHPLLDNKPTDKASYQKGFGQVVLDKAKPRVKELETLINLMTN